MNASNPQFRVIFLIVLLVALAVARDKNVRNFFAQAGSRANLSLGAAASGTPVAATKSADVTLDWHRLIYWGIAAVLLIALAEPFPQLTQMLLVLIIFEELLTHWKEYAPLLNMPTK